MGTLHPPRSCQQMYIVINMTWVVFTQSLFKHKDCTYCKYQFWIFPLCVSVFHKYFAGMSLMWYCLSGNSCSRKANRTLASLNGGQQRWVPLVSLNEGQQRLVKLSRDAVQRDSQKQGLELFGSVKTRKWCLSFPGVFWCKCLVTAARAAVPSCE